MSIRFDPNNNMIKRCMMGMSLEENGQPEDAAALFRQAWVEAADDYERFIAAYHLSRLQKSMRESDTVSRFGGDEFAMLLSFGRNEWQGITRMLSRAMRSLQRPVLIEGQKFVVTASLGISICPEDGDSPRELLKRADEAMYYAKAQGRNACAFWKPHRQYNIARFGKPDMTEGEQEK